MKNQFFSYHLENNMYFSEKNYVIMHMPVFINDLIRGDGIIYNTRADNCIIISFPGGNYQMCEEVKFLFYCE